MGERGVRSVVIAGVVILGIGGVCAASLARDGRTAAPAAPGRRGGRSAELIAGAARAKPHIDKAESAVRNGDLESAVAGYRRAIAAAPVRFPDADYELGGLLVRLGRIDEAIAAYEDGVRQGGGHQERLAFRLALCYATKRDFASAVTWYDRAKRIVRPEPDVELGEMEPNPLLQPLPAFTPTAASMGPLMAVAHAELGIDLLGEGENRIGLPDLQRSVSLHPTSPWQIRTWMNLGLTHEDLGDYRAARDAFVGARDAAEENGDDAAGARAHRAYQRVDSLIDDEN